jgi:L-ascorbate metabolism protein UlaG (beta-lactamase superfamily)
MKSRQHLVLITLFALLFLILTACGSPEPEKLTIYYAENAQFELINAQGQRVLIDIYDPDALTSPPTETDILLTTHGHGDHLDPTFIQSFPGRQLFIQEEEISAEGISIKGIASTHTAFSDDVFLPEGGSNYIYIIEMAGLRIAHFGDIGQEQLTHEQMEALGEIDIALTQFVNSYSQMDVNNAKGFNLMVQLNPRLIIPTHGNGNMQAIEKATDLWDGYAATGTGKSISLSNADLVGTTRFVVMGSAAGSMQTIYELPGWGE